MSSYCISDKIIKQYNSGGYSKLKTNVNRQVEELNASMSAINEDPHIEVKDEANIYKNLREYKLNEFLEQKRRQQLRANNHELRELERKLRNAAVVNQLREQQRNIVQMKHEELRQKGENNKKFAVECELNQKSLLHQEQLEKQKKLDLLKALKCQISELQKKRRTELEDVKKDSDEMKKLMKKIETENILQKKEAKLKQEKMLKEMEQSLRDIKIKRQLEKEKDDNIVAHNLAHQEKCYNLSQQMKAARKRIQKEKIERNELIGQQLATKNREKEKRENLFLTLTVVEYKAKEDETYKKALVERIDKRAKIRSEMENYRREVQLQKEKLFVEEENKFREEQLRYFEERDKIAQLSNEKRNRKKIDHIKSLRELIEIRRCQKANEIAEQIVAFEKKVNNEKKSNQLIEDERLFMLSTFPKELLRYLPAGVLKASDKEVFHLQE